MLRLRSISTYYGSIKVLSNVSMHVSEGEIVALLGANGAGKTTLLQTISGILSPRTGEVSFANTRINSVKPHKIVRMGISQVPEGRQVFGRLSVHDNLTLGAFYRFRLNEKKEISEDLERIYELFPRLRERHRQAAGTLSGGEQQMVAIGRALMARPKILLLDEPSMGLAPLVIKEIFQVITKLRETGVTILLVEQNANLALNIADRGYVLENGRVVLEESAAELKQNKDVQRAYLGKDYKAISE